MSGSAAGVSNSGSLVIESCTLDANKGQGASSEGGAIGTLQLSLAIETTIRNSTLSNNTATRGAGVNNKLGTVTIVNSTLSGNGAPTGGGIYNFQDAGSASVILHNSCSSRARWARTWSTPMGAFRRTEII